MGLLDVILGGLLLYGLAKGLWKGLFAELASLVSLLAGIFIAVKFSSFTAGLLKDHVSWSPRHSAITAFAITLVAVFTGVALLARFLTSLAALSGMGWLNRLLGGVFGFLKMVLLLSVLLHFFLKVNSTGIFAEKETLENSFLFKPILDVSGTLFPILEEWFREYRPPAWGSDK